MKNKIKYIPILLIMAAILVLSGCAKLDITASIDNENNVDYTYKITVTGIEDDDINYAEIKSYLGKILLHWKSAGFTSSLIETDGGFELTAAMSGQYETREEAFAALYSFMTNEVSPFTDVEYDYNLNYYYEDYYLSAGLDLENMIDDDIYTVYPSTVGADVDEFLSSFKCDVTFSLPSNESKESDAVIQKTVTQSISLNKPEEIYLSGIINNNVNARYEQALIERRAQEKMIIIISACASVLLIGVIILLSVKVKRGKKAKGEEKSLENDEKEI